MKLSAGIATLLLMQMMAAPTAMTLAPPSQPAVPKSPQLVKVSSHHAQAPLIDSAPSWNGSRPDYLTWVSDPTTGHKVIRITDTDAPIANPNKDPSLAGKTWASQAGHGYSSRVAWNADQSLIMMENGVSWETFLDGKTYQPLFSINLPGEVRWHPTNPDIVFWVSENCIGTYSTKPRKHLRKKCFADFESMVTSSPGKGLPSIDGSIIPILAKRKSDGHWVGFYFYTQTQEISKVIDLMPYVVSGRPSYFMSPKSDIIIIYGCIEGHQNPGCNAQLALDFETEEELWRDTRFHHPGHADDVVDATGRQWKVGVSKENGPLVGHIIKRNFRTGEVFVLIAEWGDHTSTRNIFDASGKIVVTYGTDSGIYSSQIVTTCPALPCPTGVTRIIDTYTVAKSYLAEGQGSISPHGDKIVFRSNLGVINGLVDCYIVELTGK